jgi:hypothetical protein
MFGQRAPDLQRVYLGNGNVWRICSIKTQTDKVVQYILNVTQKNILVVMRSTTFKEGPLTKNGPIDFAQSWAIHKKNPIKFMAKRKKGVTRHFWAHKMHVKELF